MKEINIKAFDSIIGYEPIKKELYLIIDMIENLDYYNSLGAKLPQGLVLHGDPGLGKTMMAKSFLDSLDVPKFTIRKTTDSTDLIKTITKTFNEAAKKTPSVIFIDDLDKFANEDDHHADAEEYVTIQANIDNVKDKNVFIIATTNNLRKLPKSLLRPGRFDKVIQFTIPSEEDSEKIINYYLSNKKLDPSINTEDVTKMITYSSCAQLESILNQATLHAAYKRKPHVDINDFVKATLDFEYDTNTEDDDIDLAGMFDQFDFSQKSEEEVNRIALHEAGHLVVSEILDPGYIGLASILRAKRSETTTEGFIKKCKDPQNEDHSIMVALAGKAAVEMYFADHTALGTSSDLRVASSVIKSRMVDEGYNGMQFFNAFPYDDQPQATMVAENIVLKSELNKFLLQTKQLLLDNRDFLEATWKALLEKDNLLYSDIKTLRETNYKKN